MWVWAKCQRCWGLTREKSVACFLENDIRLFKKTYSSIKLNIIRSGFHFSKLRPWSQAFLLFNSNIFNPPPLLLFSLISPFLLSSDCLSHLCWPSAFLLLGCLLLDVSGGCATLSHAGGGLWERVLPQKVLLSVRLLLSRTGGGHLRGHRLQELWDQESVRVKTGVLHLQIEKLDYAIPPAGNVICSAVWTALAPPCGLAFLNTLRQSLMISLCKIIRWDRETVCAILPVCVWVSVSVWVCGCVGELSCV